MPVNFIPAEEALLVTMQPKLTHQFACYIEGFQPMFIKSIGLPGKSNDEFKIDYINMSIKGAGKTIYQDVEMTLYDFINPSTSQLIENWYVRIHDPASNRDGYMDMYKKRVTIVQLGPSNDIVGKVTLIGAHPVSVTYPTLEMSGTADISLINVSLRYDRPEKEL